MFALISPDSSACPRFTRSARRSWTRSERWRTLLALPLAAACSPAPAPSPASPPAASAPGSPTGAPGKGATAEEGPGQPAPAEVVDEPSAAKAPPAARADTPEGEVRWTFNDVREGALPGGAEATGGTWAVRAAKGGAGKVLVQEARRTDPDFNVLLFSEPVLADVDLSVRLHALSGVIDRGGGPVWRAQDGRNYYIARYNPLEDNFRVYKVVKGRRSQIGSAKVRIDGDAWHTIRVVMRGDHILCELDGKPLLDVRDGTFATAGRVGLWTKADAHTEFDDLVVKEPSK